MRKLHWPPNQCTVTVAFPVVEISAILEYLGRLEFGRLSELPDFQTHWMNKFIQK